MNEITKRIIEIIGRQFDMPEGVIELDTPISVLPMDSIDQVEMAMNLEMEFDIEIDDDQFCDVKFVSCIDKIVKEGIK